MFEQNLSEAEKAYFIRAKKRLAFLLSLFLAVLILFFAAKLVSELSSTRFIGQGIAPTNTLSVAAAGEVFLKPDIARVNLAVARRAKTASEAQRQSSEAINAVVAFLRKSNIAEKDIKTVGYNLSPLYDYLQDRGQVLKGYEIRQELLVKIRNLDQAGEILSGATETGVNQVSSFVLTIDDEEKVVNEARSQAIAKAQSKAKVLAGELKIKLGRLVSFSEFGGEEFPSPLRLDIGGEMKAIAPAIPTGENKVAVNVTLTYEIR